MRKLILSGWVGLLCLTFPHLVNAQTYDWAAKVGNDGADQGTAVTVDGSNNVIVGGFVIKTPTGSATMNINPLGTATNINAVVAGDAYIGKYDTDGILIKGYKWSGIGEDKIYDITTDASNNIYAIGYGKGSVNVDPAFTAASLICGSQGGIIVVKLPPNFAPGAPGVAVGQTWALTITDATSTTQTLGSSGNIGYGIVTDAAGDVYITGSFAGTNVNFDPLNTGTPYYMSTSSNADHNIFVAKYNGSNGHMVWAINLGSTNTDAGMGIALDGSSNVYITGKFAGQVDMDPSGATSNISEYNFGGSGYGPGIEGFVAKYNSSGAYQWAFAFGTPYSEQGRSIAVTSTGTVFVTGYIQAESAPLVDMDPSGGTAYLTSAGGTDMFVASYTSAGAYVWAKNAGGSGFNVNDEGLDVRLDASGQPYVTGFVSGTTVNFGAESVTVAGLKDGFYAKYNAANGTNLWAKGISGTGDDLVSAIALDASSNIALAGYFNGSSVDFDPSAATNALSSTTSSTDIFFARYTQCAAPVIGTQPTAQSVCATGTATFTVIATGGTLSYQWKKDGTTNVGTNSATLTLTNVSAADVASYSVEVSNTCPATITSSSVGLTLKTATSITTQPTFTGPLCAGGTLNLSVVAAGSGTLSYVWKQGTTTVGTNSASYSKGSVTTGDNGNYTVAVTGDCGTVTSSVAAVTVSAATSITTQPTFTGPLCAGGTLNLSVVAAGSGTLSYVWKQGTTTVGTNSASYSKGSVTTADNGNYTVAVTGDCGTVTSSIAAVTVSAATSITTQPTFTGPLCAGGTLNLSVVAAGSGTLSYVWKQGTTTVGTNSASYSKGSVTTADNGNYTVAVTGTCGTVTSSVAAVTVSAATSITTQPTFTGPLCAGGTLNLSVVAAGSGTLSYVWKQGTTTVGTNSASYSKGSVTTADNGNYTVAVTGDCGTVTSSIAAVTVSSATSITTQPTFTGPLCAGGTLNLSVVAAGSGTLSYVWKQGTTTVGTNSASYSKGSVTTADNGNYTVAVTGDCGTVTSSIAAVTVSAATSITTQPTFTGPLCAGGTLNLSVVAAGSGTLSYVWKQGTTTVGINSSSYSKGSVTAADNGTYTVAVTGDCGTVTSSNVVVALSAATAITTQPTFTGPLCAGGTLNLSVVATGSGTLSYVWKQGSTTVGTNAASYSKPSVTTADNGTYTVEVTGSCGTITSSNVVVALSAATAITTQPTFTGPLCAGNTLNLSVVATGSGTLSYVWKQGTTTVGTNSASYSKASATTADDGSYTVVVTGACGSVTSSVAAVTISTAPSITTQPTNESICSGSPSVSFTVVASGTAPLNYQWKKGLSNVGTNSATYTISSPVAGDAGTYSVVVSNVCTPSVTSNSATLAIGVATAINTQPSFTGPLCQGSTLSLSVSAVGSNLTYQWKQGSTNVGTSSATYSKPSATTADNGTYSVIVTGDCGTVTSSTVPVVISTPPSITTQPTATNACPSGSATFTVVATGTNLSYQWVKNGTTNVGTNAASYTISPVNPPDAGNYTVVVTGTCSPSVTSSSVALTVGGSPVINTQPLSQSVCLGSPATFTVVASGSGLTYQWKKGGTDIGSATSASYTIPTAAVADAASYTVSVTSSCGSTLSSAAVLSVKTLPSITTQPTAQTVCSGSALNISVLASGTSLQYQWRQNGSDISGANSATYHVDNASAADAGSYAVFITNGCTPDVTSNTVAVTINELPAITVQPVNVSVCATGQSATFNVTATGTGLSYQWVKNGTTNVGTNSDSYTIPSVLVGDVGNYAVTVSGACTPAVTSSTVTLSIASGTVTIVTQPVSQALCENTDDLNLVVAATGPSLSYQWKKGTTNVSNGGNVSGATTANLTITGVALGDAGSYTCEITSGCASPATSDAAVVTVTTCTGVMVQQGNMFYVSPNPGTENFYLNASGIADGEATITIMNTLGNEVWSGNAYISGGSVEQLLSVNLPAGVYTVVMSNDNGNYATRMVVQK